MVRLPSWFPRKSSRERTETADDVFEAARESARAKRHLPIGPGADSGALSGDGTDAAPSHALTHRPLEDMAARLHHEFAEAPPAADGDAIPNELLDGVDELTLKFITPEIARANQIIPYRYDYEEMQLHIATNGVFGPFQRQTVVQLLRRSDIERVNFTPVPEEYFGKLLDEHYRPFPRPDEPAPSEGTAAAFGADRMDVHRAFGFERTLQISPREISEKQRGTPEDFLDYVLFKARKSRASDLHFDVENGNSIITIEIDGKPYRFCPPIKGRDVVDQTIRVQKARCKLQTGRIFKPVSATDVVEVKINGEWLRLRLRCEFQPAASGETLTIRLQGGAKSPMSIDDPHIDDRTRAEFKDIPTRASGIHLWVARMGEGKTSTIHTVTQLDPADLKHWLSIQDPVEFEIPGMRSLEVTEDAPYPVLLKSLLRAARKKWVIGEIRDEDVAKVAFEAANTGHLVLSTLHAPDTNAAFRRLEDLKIPLSAAGSAVKTVVSQVLLPKLCRHCKIPMAYGVDYTEQSLILAGFDPSTAADAQLFKARPGGCGACLEGTRGRVPVFETLRVTPLIKEIIDAGGPNVYRDMRAAAIHDGLIPLRKGALRAVAAGEVSLAEATSRTSWSSDDGPVAQHTRRAVESFKVANDIIHEHYDSSIRAFALENAKRNGLIPLAARKELTDGSGGDADAPPSFILNLDGDDDDRRDDAGDPVTN